MPRPRQFSIIRKKTCTPEREQVFLLRKDWRECFEGSVPQSAPPSSPSSFWKGLFINGIEKTRFEKSFAPTLGRESGVNSTRQQSEWPTRRPANEVTAAGRKISSTPQIFFNAKTSLARNGRGFCCFGKNERDVLLGLLDQKCPAGSTPAIPGGRRVFYLWFQCFAIILLNSLNHFHKQNYTKV